MMIKLTKAALLDILAELKSRLIKSIIYLFIFFIICYFFAENIYAFLVEPYAKAVKDDGAGQATYFYSFA